LLNISNDGWFDGTSEHDQHLAICRFRAIECRRAVARAVNMGISAVIDGNGRVVALPGPTWAQSKKMAAVLTATIPIDARSSLYARWGDWLPWACWITIGGGFFWGILLPKRLSSGINSESSC
jgi:apolipoprotein N-acyltransferase